MFDVTENIIFHQKQYPKYQKDLLRQTTEYFSLNITLKCQTRRTSKKRKEKKKTEKKPEDRLMIIQIQILQPKQDNSAARTARTN